MAQESNSTRRSDEIRARRSDRQGARQAVVPARRRYQKTADYVAPVLVRNPAASPASGARRSSARPRRRIDVSLPSAPGAEIRLPSLPHIGFSWRFVSLLLVAAAAFGLYQLWNLPAFQVQSAEVVGLRRISAREVNAQLGLTGKPIFTLNPLQIKARLMEAFPEFAAVSVQLRLPDALVIEVTERKPVMTWVQGGYTELVDADGMSFPLRDEAAALEGPVVQASVAPPTLFVPDLEALNAPAGTTPVEALPTAEPAGAVQKMTPELVTAVIELAAKSPAGVPLLYSERGLGWKDPRGWEVFFGDAQEMPAKLSVYSALSQKLIVDGVLPQLISVEFVHAPYFRAEPQEEQE